MRRAKRIVLLGLLLGTLVGGVAAIVLLRQRPASAGAEGSRGESLPWKDLLKLGEVLLSILRNLATRE